MSDCSFPLTSLGECVTLMKSGLSRSLSQEDIGLPVLRSTNLTDKGLSFDDIRYWYKEDPQGADTSNYLLEDGDVLVNFINSVSQIGKVNRPGF